MTSMIERMRPANFFFWLLAAVLIMLFLSSMVQSQDHEKHAESAQAAGVRYKNM